MKQHDENIACGMKGDLEIHYTDVFRLRQGEQWQVKTKRGFKTKGNLIELVVIAVLLMQCVLCSSNEFRQLI